MTRLDEQVRVGAHERHRHGDLRPVRKEELGATAELLDHAEDVVPAAGVQRRRVLAERVQDLVHLEGRQDRLDQHRRADRTSRQADHILREREHVVPEGGLCMALELRQVHVGTGSPVDELPGVQEEPDAEVEERGGHGLSIDVHVPLGQMPASRPAR